MSDERDDAAAETPEPDAVAADDKPAKKKKKKQAKLEAALADPRALEIRAAFDAGNFARVRELGAALATGEDGALAAVGRDYLARVAVDPIQIAFLVACAVALLTIAWIYLGH